MFDNVSNVILCDGHNRSEPFSEDKLHFLPQTSIVILHGRHSTSVVSCCLFFANRIVIAASSGDNVHIPWQAWHFVRHAEKLTDALGNSRGKLLALGLQNLEVETL